MHRRNTGSTLRQCGEYISAIFLIAGLLLVLPEVSAFARQDRLTAQQVVERIQDNLGVEWQEQTIDTFKAGDPDTQVTGIATTFLATLDVLQRAVASGSNLIITHEPTFYNHFEDTDDLEKANDPVLAAKKAYLEKHGLVVWRFHDHWHLRKPDGINTGMIRALGWERYRSPNGDNLFVIPETTLASLASEVGRRLGAGSVRVIGDPQLKLTRAAFLPGAASSLPQMLALGRDEVQTLLIGETREWETVEYARDAVTAGMPKALIIIGHVASEEAGMDECARWLKTFVTEVPVEFIPAGEPYWSAE